MKLLDNMIDFVTTLTLVDIVFLVAVVMLIILIVTLIYFIKINKNYIEDNDSSDDDKNDKNNSIKELENIVESLSSENIKQIDYDDEEGELLDLNSLTKKLEQKESERIDVTAYEKDQEEKAIISYDELLEKHHNYAINYEEEKKLDDVIVKKVKLDDLVNQNTEEYSIKDVKVIKYEQEEAFLQTLQELNRLLN